MSGSALVVAIAAGVLSAQQPPASPPYAPKQSDRPSAVTGDEPGFTPIFDGKSLAGWAGNPGYWRAENGSLVGEITPATVIKSNTFAIWQGGRPRDFELKLEYRITAGGNSGINYRSAVVPDPVTPANAFALKGYQLDIDGQKAYAGNNYEEKGRLFLAVRGQMTRVVGGRPPIVLATFGDSATLGAVVTDDWNAVHLIVRGHVATHIINGHLMTVVTDDDPPNRPADGSIGVQVHVGGPMKVEYRNIRIKTY
ncbi:MAG: DUF1080 domain-containing protein [Vicinamibacterales bacterium]